MGTERRVRLRAVAEAIVAGLPPRVEEAELTASVSRGGADELSDIEMLLVTEGELELAGCYLLAAGAGLMDLGAGGEQRVPTKRVSGYHEGVPIELIGWSRPHAERAVDASFAGERSAAADALANGIALRTSGLL